VSDKPVVLFLCIHNSGRSLARASCSTTTPRAESAWSPPDRNRVTS